MVRRKFLALELFDIESMVEGGQRGIACFDNALSIEAVNVLETEKRSLQNRVFSCSLCHEILLLNGRKCFAKGWAGKENSPQYVL